MGACFFPLEKSDASSLCATYETAIDRMGQRIFYPRRYELSLTVWQENEGRLASSPEHILQLIRLDPILGSPEGLMALADNLNPNQSLTFATLIKKIHDAKRDVVFDLYWKDSQGGGWFGAQQRNLPTRRGTNPFKRTKYLKLRTAEAPPQTLEELYSEIFALSHNIAQYHAETMAMKAPLISLPFGSSTYSFPRPMMDALLTSEAHIYANLQGLQKISPTTAEESVQRPASAISDRISFAFETLSTIIFPFYNPIKGLKPNKANFDRYLRDFEAATKSAIKNFPHLKGGQDAVYLKRARLKWFNDHYRIIIFGGLLIVTAQSLFDIYEFVTSGEFVANLEEANRLKARLTDKEAMKEAMDRYAADMKGNQVVLDFYNVQIEAIKLQIEKEGDPTGALATSIAELEKSRDFLKN